MNTTIRFKVKKEVDTPTTRRILTLKGNLIAQSYTDIIYFDDEGEEFYVHYFTTETKRKKEVSDYITACIARDSLSDVVLLLPEKGY